MLSRFSSSLKIRLPKKTNNFNVPIFDCHQHLWNINAWHPSWLSAIPSLNENFEVPKYLNYMNYSMNIVGSILVETDPELNDFNEEALYMTEVCADKDNSSLAFIGSCEIASIYFSKHISQFLKNPFYRGCRQVLMNKPLDFLKQAVCLSNIQLLGRKKLLFQVLMVPENLFALIDVVSLCKNTVFIIDHCGGIQGLKDDREKIHSWYKTIEILSKYENVVFKLSGLRGGWGSDEFIEKEGWSFSLQRNFLIHILNNVNQNKVFFGSDWPVNQRIKEGNLFDYFQKTRELATVIGGDNLVHKIFTQNAMRIFDLYEVKKSKPEYLQRVNCF